MQLKLARCTIRDWRKRDLDSLVRHANDREVWRNLRDRFPHPYTEEHGRRWIEWVAELDPCTQFAIEVDGEAAGGIGLERLADVYRVTAELGYWLGRPVWGRGIMTEAVAAFTAWAFDRFDFQRIQAGVFASNPASARVLEKAGFQLEGVMRQCVIKDGEVLDHLLYAKLRYRDRVSAPPN